MIHHAFVLILNLCPGHRSSQQFPPKFRSNTNEGSPVQPGYSSMWRDAQGRLR